MISPKPDFDPERSMRNAMDFAKSKHGEPAPMRTPECRHCGETKNHHCIYGGWKVMPTTTQRKASYVMGVDHAIPGSDRTVCMTKKRKRWVIGVGYMVKSTEWDGLIGLSDSPIDLNLIELSRPKELRGKKIRLIAEELP